MKNLLLVLTLVITASPAFASRARLESLGEGKNGSYYIQDGRNMFLNPAVISKYKKKLMLELGSPSGIDNAANSVGQGGFINTFGDFTYALYLNNTSDTMAGAAALLGATAPDASIEFQLAGEGSVNWGLGVTTAGNNNGDRSASYWAVRAGIEKDNLAVFTTVGLTSSIKNGTTDLLKGKSRIDVGATYGMDDMTVFGKFSTSNTEISAVENVSTSFGAGLGWNKEMTKSTHMFTRLEADYATAKVAGNTTSKAYNVPVVLGAETQALSWLAVRGSIGHSLIGQNITGRTDLTGLTSVGAGVGMTFGDLTIDGLVSSNGAVTPVSASGIGMNGVSTKDNFGFGSDMITRVAMTYNF